MRHNLIGIGVFTFMCYCLSWVICQIAFMTGVAQFGWGNGPFAIAFETNGFVPFIAGDHIMGMMLVMVGGSPLFGLINAIALEKSHKSHIK